MVEKHIILNYDLGLKGDYNGLYSFLDNLNAIEIGNSSAAFEMKFSEDDFNTIFHELREKLKEGINIEKTDRIYVIIIVKANVRGGFLFGQRKRAMWKGYGVKTSQDFDNF